MCTRASVSVCACVFVIVPFSLAAGAATPGQAGGESERGGGGGGGWRNSMVYASVFGHAETHTYTQV